MEVWGGNQLTARGVAFGGLDVWVYSKPYGEARSGGDIYYASSCATGRITRLLLADVAGHGQAVAATAADLRILMRRFVNRLEQTEFVRLLNQEFLALSRQGSFATAIVTTFFEPTRRLTVCNVGHPRPLVYRVAQQRWDYLGDGPMGDGPSAKPVPGNIPLGLMDIAEYQQYDVELQPGDCVLSYTDALIESKDADGEMLGEDGVLRLARLIGELGPQEFAETLLKEIAERYPENLSADDVTVLIIRATGNPAHYSVRDKFGAFLRLSRSLLVALSPRAERPPLPDANLANIGGAFIPALGRRWRATVATRRLD